MTDGPTAQSIRLVPFRDQANCRDLGVDSFFPDGGRVPDHLRQLCGTCPVQTECLEWALRWNEEGIWGGKSKPQRARIRRRRNRDAA